MTDDRRLALNGANAGGGALRLTRKRFTFRGRQATASRITSCSIDSSGIFW
jgi:hypothetical protein